MININEKNKRLWLVYSTILRILGWLCVCMGGIGFVMLLLEYIQTGGEVTFKGEFRAFKRSYNIFVNIGLLSLGLSQLLRYLCGNNKKMGPLLRYGDKILYLYAIITVLKVGFWIWLDAMSRMDSITSAFPNQVQYITIHTSKAAYGLHWFILFLPTLLYQGAKVLILIGLGKFLKYSVAIIKESKQSSEIKTAV